MSKFTCKNKSCIDSQKENDEEIRLLLTITEETRHQYYINSDGSLEHDDSDSIGQEFNLECQACGQKYEFDQKLSWILEQHVLPLSVKELKEIKIKKC